MGTEPGMSVETSLGQVEGGRRWLTWLPLPLGLGALVSAGLWLGAQGPVGAVIVGILSVVLSISAIVTWKVARPRRRLGAVGLVMALAALVPLLFLLGLLAMGEG